MGHEINAIMDQQGYGGGHTKFYGTDPRPLVDLAIEKERREKQRSRR